MCPEQPLAGLGHLPESGPMSWRLAQGHAHLFHLEQSRPEQPEAATSLFQHLETHRQTKQNARDFQCSDVAAQKLLFFLQAYSRLGQPEDAQRAFWQLEADRRAAVDEVALCTLIAALAHGGRLSGASALLPRVNAMAAAKGEASDRRYFRCCNACHRLAGARRPAAGRRGASTSCEQPC